MTKNTFQKCPFLLRTFQAVEKDDEVNKNEHCESYFLSKLGSLWTQIKLDNKDITEWGSWPFPAPEFLLLLCMRSDHTPAVTKLNFF